MILQAGNSQAELHETQGAEIYLLHNASLELLLFNRNLLGAEFREVCLASSRHYVRHIADELQGEDCAELVILSKGLIYQLSEAVRLEFGQNLPTNLVATSRVAVTGDSARVAVTYSQIEAPAQTVLIGDTVASGATVVAALESYTRLHSIERLFVLSYAGTEIGARRITRFCVDRSIRCTFLYGLAVFGLGDNGFDLAFLHPDTVARDGYKQRASEQFGGRPVSAVGWDFGSQAMAPEKYRQLCWIEAELWHLNDSPCLRVASKPSNLNALAHERAAYAQHLSAIQLSEE